MTKEEMLTNLEENRNSYQYNTGGMNLAYFAFGNPITDSMVVNAYAKTNKTAFEFALNTGVGYGNHSMLGGNFVYNFLYNNKLVGEKMGLKNAGSWSFRPFEKIPLLNKSQSLKNFSINFVSSKELDGAGKVVSEYSEKTGLNKTSEIVRTGFGIGRNYNDFFSALKETGFSMNNFNVKSNVYAGKEVNKKLVSAYIKNMDSSTYETFMKYVDDDIAKKVGKVRNFKKSVANDSVIKAFEKFVSENKEIAGLNWNKFTLKSELFEHIKTLDDTQIKKIADSFIKAGGKLNKYDAAAKVISKEVKEEIAEVAGMKFASRTAFEKILSNPLVRAATGAAVALPASVAIPLAVATTGIGVIASAGQENAINNFLDSHLYNTNQYDRYSSEEATASMYSASNIRDVNLQAIYNSYSKINVANKYLNDMDPISSDYSYKLEDTETA